MHQSFSFTKPFWLLNLWSLPDHLEPPENSPDLALSQSRFNGRKNPGLLREMHHGHLAAITYLDTQIGKVLNELDRLGLRDDTIIVYWSDHGIHIGEHGLVNKRTVFEMDAAVPLIIDSPRHSSGQRTSALVELLDLYPTIIELCGLDAPHELEGRSLVPLLQDPNRNLRETALTQTPRPDYKPGESPQTMGYSIRTDRFRYTEWRDFKSGALVARELYDHDVDHNETVNVIGQSNYKRFLPSLETQLEERVK